MHKHEWIVYSTALMTGSLMLQCSECDITGDVFDPSQAEWSRAWSAPSNPYTWDGGDSRVIVDNTGADVAGEKEAVPPKEKT